MPEKKVDDFLYENDSYKIRGSFFSVYNALGGGIREKTIENALYKELKDLNFIIEKQKRLPIKYKNEEIGYYIPDLIINHKIIVEIKSKPFLTEQDKKQFWSYLKGTEYKLGFLVNFSNQKLEIRRLTNSQSARIS